jgi:hypothetical protein
MASAILFVHLGREIPAFTRDALHQAALFSDGPIYLIAEGAALSAFRLHERVSGIPVEDLRTSEAHKTFRTNIHVRPSKIDLWIASIERFFYLATAMSELGLQNALHLETDVMLYRDVEQLCASLSTYYRGLAAPFMDNRRVIPGIVFLPSAAAVEIICLYFVANIRSRPGPELSEMLVLRRAYDNLGPDLIDALPILPHGHRETLVTRQGIAATDPEIFRRNAKELGCVFDAAAFGQYLGGTDQRTRRGCFFLLERRPRPELGPGFLNESSYVDPSRYAVRWTADGQGRLQPFIVQDERAVPIANLHIHSKNLSKFASDRVAVT